MVSSMADACWWYLQWLMRVASISNLVVSFSMQLCVPSASVWLVCVLQIQLVVLFFTSFCKFSKFSTPMRACASNLLVSKIWWCDHVLVAFLFIAIHYQLSSPPLTVVHNQLASPRISCSQPLTAILCSTFLRKILIVLSIFQAHPCPQFSRNLSSLGYISPSFKTEFSCSLSPLKNYAAW